MNDDNRSKAVWVLEYAPHPDELLVRVYSCITYDKVPPGYKQQAAALPLIPERLYRVLIMDIKREAPMTWVHFIIRSDLNGSPIKLEYLKVKIIGFSRHCPKMAPLEGDLEYSNKL